MINKLLRAIAHPDKVSKMILSMYHEHSEKRCAKADSKALREAGQVLFIDLGANLGQGFSWFSKYFDSPNIKFELFEPNPNCYQALLRLPEVVSGEVSVRNVGVGAKSGTFKFYGLSEDEGGELSQGGSIIKEHNSDRYQASDSAAIDVEIIDFAEYLGDVAQKFDKIVVKMDIEGAEVELLEALIENDSIELIDFLYVEFHSQYQSRELSGITKMREANILKNLKNRTNVNVRIWH